MREGDDLGVLVVDDERLARQLVRDVLASMAGVKVVGECGDGSTAVSEIGRLRPDLVLLDVQMPEMDGFEVLQRVGPDAMPDVIFVTAHEQYTLRAFDVHAVDYVLKPIDPVRLVEAVEHARERIAVGRRASLSLRLEGLMEELSSGRTGVGTSSARRITVRKGDAIQFVATHELDWLEAARNYVRLHRGEEEFLVRTTLKDLLRRLEPSRFVRIHRSAVVNLERVESVRPLPGGDYAVALGGGRELRASRTYAQELLKLVH